MSENQLGILAAVLVITALWFGFSFLYDKFKEWFK